MWSNKISCSCFIKPLRFPLTINIWWWIYLVACHHAYKHTFDLKIIFFTDKSPQMNEFLSQIKQSTELAAMFESIQKDAQSSPTDIMMMDTSWVSQTLDSLSGSLECLCKRIERVIDKCCVSVFWKWWTINSVCMEWLFLVNVQTNVSFAVLILFVTSLKCCSCYVL